MHKQKIWMTLKRVIDEKLNKNVQVLLQNMVELSASSMFIFAFPTNKLHGDWFNVVAESN